MIIGQEKNKNALGRAIELDLPVLLIGETGTGKTSIIREIAEEKKKDLIRVNLNGQTSIDEILGKWLVKGGGTYWQDGVLIQAMRQGKWVLVDEINAALPEILFALHSLLDDDKKITIAEKDGETVVPHKNFRFFATMNPTEEYAGTKELNKAFMSRFPMVLSFETLSSDIEKDLLIERCKIDESTAIILTQIAANVRKLKKEERVFYTFSTRDLLYWGNFVEELGLKDSFLITIINRIHKEEQETVTKEYNSVMKNVDEQIRKVEAKYGTSAIGDIFENIRKREDELDAKEKRILTLKKNIISKVTKEVMALEKEAGVTL